MCLLACAMDDTLNLRMMLSGCLWAVNDWEIWRQDYCMCLQACPVPRTCSHAEGLPAHPCHFGACPSCEKPCGMKQVSSPPFLLQVGSTSS